MICGIDFLLGSAENHFHIGHIIAFTQTMFDDILVEFVVAIEIINGCPKGTEVTGYL